MTVRGTTQTLSVTFRESPNGPLVDPTSLTLAISLDGDPILETSTVVHDGPGLYHYEWVIPLDAEPGTYTILWGGLLPGNTTPTYGYETVDVTEFEVPEEPFGGCLWPMDPGCQTDEWNAHSQVVKDRALAMASATLQRLVGGRVSACPITIRPTLGRTCPPPGALAYGWGSPAGGMRWGEALNWGGTWRNVPCPMPSACEVVLPAPVGEVYEVKVDGAVIDTTDYRVDQEGGRNLLVWQGDGDCPWPTDQDMSLPDDAVGTFSVTYLNAYPVDSLGAFAVGVLAQEFANACESEGKCRLPANVTSIVRQGVSMQVVSGSFPNGETGLSEVDTYIGLWNPQHRRQAVVWNPQGPRIRITG